jgi:hypothetical protein
MPILDLILGRPLASDEDKDERVGPLAGISVFGLLKNRLLTRRAEPSRSSWRFSSFFCWGSRIWFRPTKKAHFRENEKP